MMAGEKGNTMKKYLTEIRSGRGAVVSIAYYADTPNKNYRVYYHGSDSGLRYEKAGNAARYLAFLAERWKENGQTNIVYRYRTKDEIPRRGSNA